MIGFPKSILYRICRYLTAADTFTLSLSCKYMRDKLGNLIKSHRLCHNQEHLYTKTKFNQLDLIFIDLFPIVYTQQIPRPYLYGCIALISRNIELFDMCAKKQPKIVELLYRSIIKAQDVRFYKYITFISTDYILPLTNKTAFLYLWNFSVEYRKFIFPILSDISNNLEITKIVLEAYPNVTHICVKKHITNIEVIKYVHENRIIYDFKIENRAVFEFALDYFDDDFIKRHILYWLEKVPIYSLREYEQLRQKYMIHTSTSIVNNLAKNIDNHLLINYLLYHEFPALQNCNLSFSPALMHLYPKYPHMIRNIKDLYAYEMNGGDINKIQHHHDFEIQRYLYQNSNSFGPFIIDYSHLNGLFHIWEYIGENEKNKIIISEIMEVDAISLRLIIKYYDKNYGKTLTDMELFECFTETENIAILKILKKRNCLSDFKSVKFDIN